MHKLILVFYIPRFAQTRAAQCHTNIEGKVCGRWQWRFGGWIRYTDDTQGDGRRCRGDERRVQKVIKANVVCWRGVVVEVRLLALCICRFRSKYCA